jgi:hypothetical protein
MMLLFSWPAHSDGFNQIKNSWLSLLWTTKPSQFFLSDFKTLHVSIHMTGRKSYHPCMQGYLVETFSVANAGNIMDHAHDRRI